MAKGIKKQDEIAKMRVWLPFALIILINVIIIGLFWFLKKPENPLAKKNKPITEINEPRFVKEGELFFINQADTNKRFKIDIEIADNETDRNQGLMFRRSMADTSGMLFVFEDSQPRSFWMKNTHISLDIIFVNRKHKILNIQKNTVPFSEASLPSDGNAMYVVEVNAGFTDQHGIKPGDRISFHSQK